MKDSVADSSKLATKALVMKVTKSDARFAVDAADGGMAEVALGQLAEQKAVGQPVKDFGTMMVKDHSKANDQLKELAQKKGISLPKSLSDENQKLKNDLSAKSGESFDKAYVKAMIKDHKDDIKKFDEATRNVKDTDLRYFFVNTLPVLKMHLATIEKIDKAMKK
jgi:putative membrane protein